MKADSLLQPDISISCALYILLRDLPAD